MQNDHDDDEIGVNTQNDISFSKQSDRRQKKTPFRSIRCVHKILEIVIKGQTLFLFALLPLWFILICPT